MSTLLTMLVSNPIIVVFLGLNLVIGFWAHRRSRAGSFEDYALASRDLPTAVLVMTLLGTALSRGELSFVYNAFKGGILGAHIPIAVVLFLFLVATFIAPKLASYTNITTQGDLMGFFYGKRAKVIMGIFGFYVSVLIVSSQIKAIGWVSASLLNVNEDVAMVFFGGVIFLYSIFGGLRAVSYTDVLQGIIAFIFFSWIASKALYRVGGLGELYRTLWVKHPGKMTVMNKGLYRQLRVALFFGFSGAFTLTLPTFQRMLVTYDKRKVRNAWYVSAILYGLICSFLFIVGLVILAKREIFNFPAEIHITFNKGGLLLEAIKGLYQGNSWIIASMFVSILAVLFSTIDSYLHAIGISFLQDIVVPARGFLNKPSLDEKEKVKYAKMGVLLGSVLSLLLSLIKGNPLGYRYVTTVLLSGFFIIPLLLGILGVKTDVYSWINYCVAYGVCLVFLYRRGWSRYDYFPVSLLVSVCVYFITHVYVNRGVVWVSRVSGSGYRTSERLWVPSVRGVGKQLWGWVRVLGDLPQWSRSEVFHGKPVQSLGFSMMLFCIYVLGSMTMVGGGEGFTSFMVVIRAIGIVLCCGLMLGGIWPQVVRPYFPLYWMVTVFYCLPLAGTLVFLRMHVGLGSLLFFVGSFVLLSFVVRSRVFIGMVFLGFLVAHVGWYGVMGSLPAGLFSDGEYRVGVLLVGLLGVGVVLLVGAGEKYMADRLYMTKAFGSAIPHEVRNHLRDVTFVGYASDQFNRKKVPMKGPDGEKGFFISEETDDIVKNNGDKLKAALGDMQLEFSRFQKLLDRDISAEPQEVVKAKLLVSEVLAKFPRRYTEGLSVEVVGTQDFEMRVIRPFFGNVVSNFLKNAKKHGAATEMKIIIDGKNRSIRFRDNGRGISAEVLPRIFDLRFTTGGETSSGVGLPLIRLILAASGVRITCESRRNKKDGYTAFILMFPQV